MKETNTGVIAEATKGSGRFLSVLEAHLQGRDSLVGDGFSISDLNVASILAFCQFIPVLLCDRD